MRTRPTGFDAAASWAVGTIMLITAVAYRGVLSNQFVLDDAHTVARNPAVQSLTRVGDWFTSPYAASGVREHVNYRPVAVASYAIDRALWGPSPVGFHATNLVIHLGVVALVFALGRRLGRAAAAGACAATVFALHPINAEAVNYVSARSSSLAALWLLAAIWAQERADEGGHRAWRALAYVSGAAALGTKEIAVVLPVLVVVWRRATRAGEPWSVTWWRSLPWWGVTAGFLILRTWVLWGLLEPAVTGAGATLGQNTLFALKIYAASWGHWLWPVGLAADHAWPLWVTAPEAALIVASVAAALGATALMLRRYPTAGWCAAWFWVAILPAGALGFVSRLALYQDNRTYLAGVGLAWLAGQGLAAAWPRLGARRVTQVAAAVGVVAVIGVAAVADASRTAVWADRASLWRDVLAKYPASLMAHNGMGLVAFEAGRFDEALEWFDRAVHLAPGFAEGHKNLGITHARMGHWDQAIAALEVALSLHPGYAEARISLGKVHEHRGRPDLALAEYDRVLQDDPGNEPVLGRTATLLAQAGRLPEAAARYERVLAGGRADSETATAYGVVLLQLGRWEDAERVFSALADRYPDSYLARFNLAAALDGRGVWERAVEEYRKAAALSANDPDPWFRIGVLLSKQERWPDATAAYQQALTRNPGHGPTHMNLGILAERLGEPSRAITHYEAVLRSSGSAPEDDALRDQARAAVAHLRQGPRTSG